MQNLVHLLAVASLLALGPVFADNRMVETDDMDVVEVPGHSL